MKSKLFSLLTISVLLTCTSNAWAEREIQEGDTAYYCDMDGNGRHGGQGWSAQPCEEFGAKEIRRGVFSNGPKPVPPPPPEKITDPATETNFVDDGKPHPTPNKAIAEADARRDAVLKDGRKALLKMFVFALVAGVLAKMTGRSFVFWFFLGAVVRFGLAVTMVLSF